VEVKRTLLIQDVYSPPVHVKKGFLSNWARSKKAQKKNWELRTLLRKIRGQPPHEWGDGTTGKAQAFVYLSKQARVQERRGVSFSYPRRRRAWPSQKFRDFQRMTTRDEGPCTKTHSMEGVCPLKSPRGV